MAGDIEIRLATVADESQLLDMGAEFYAVTAYPERAPYDRETVRELIRLMHQGVFVVADCDGVLLGMVGLIVTPFLFNASVLSAHEVMWWVDPAAVGNGIGGRLLSAAETVARERGAVIMQMIHLPASPPAAAKLYERAGFTQSEVSYTKAL